MRIAYFVDKFPLISETFVLGQVCGIIDQGHDVVIYANRVVESKVRHPIIDSYRLLDRTVVLPQVPRRFRDRLHFAFQALNTAAASGRLRAALRCLNVFRFRREALRCSLLIRFAPLIGEEPFHVLHCQFGQLGVAVQSIRDCGIADGALVTSFRGTDAMKIATRYPHQFARLFENGDRFLAVSRAIGQRLEDLGCPRDKISILRSGVDLTRFEYRGYSEPHDPIRLLTIARLVPIKGIEFALRAVRHLGNSGVDVEYRVLGDGPSAAALAELTKTLGIEERVAFEGRVDSVRVREALQEADILLAPSITGPGGEQEGLPNSLKEAMATGIPSITTNTGGIPELIQEGQTGYIVDEKDATALAEKVTSLVRNWHSTRAEIDAARRRIESEYDLTSLNRDIEVIYREVAREFG